MSRDSNRAGDADWAPFRAPPVGLRMSTRRLPADGRGHGERLRVRSAESADAGCLVPIAWMASMAACWIGALFLLLYAGLVWAGLAFLAGWGVFALLPWLPRSRQIRDAITLDEGTRTLRISSSPDRWQIAAGEVADVTATTTRGGQPPVSSLTITRRDGGAIDVFGFDAISDLRWLAEEIERFAARHAEVGGSAGPN